MAIDLDLFVQGTAPQSYRVDIHIHPDAQSAPIIPLAAPVPVGFDLARLRELVFDPLAYGAALGGMLFAQPELRAGFAQARAVAAQQGQPLRLRLTISPEAEALHALRWETLSDPLTPEQPLAASTQVLFSRVLSSADWQPLRPRRPGALRALVLVAAPVDLPDYGLAPLDPAREIAQARAELGPCALTVLGGEACASLPALSQGLRSDPDMLLIIAHGRTDDTGQTWLYLEDAAGYTVPVPSREIVTRIAAMVEKPRLIVLGCCDSGGDGTGATLLSLGPLLVRAGVAAVLAMQHRITQETLGQFLWACFRALQEDGRIDRAVAVARDYVRGRPDWWVPALFVRLTDGCLWRTPAPPSPPAPLDPPQSGALSTQQREALLSRLALRYHRCLENALAHYARLQIGLSIRPDAVDPLWRRLHLRDSSAVQLLPSGTPLLQIFDAQEDQLLVLGAPGAGKTMLIVELAQALTARAQADPRARIPVVLNVAAWRGGQTMRGWLPSALRDALGCSKRFASQLANGDELLLLLDGLDEVAADQRAACVQAINEYLGERDLTPPLAVACRSQVYAGLGAKLQIAGAVELAPLDLATVERTLAGLPEVRGVLAALQTDTLLRELATTPLMINVLLLAHGGMAMPLMQSQTVEERRRALWITYVQRMLIQHPMEQPWRAVQALRRLRWLAQRLRVEHTANFLIDDLQPQMLPSRRLRWCYRGLSGLAIGLAIGLASAVVIGLASGLFSGLQSGLVTGLFMGVLSGLRIRMRIQREEEICWSWARIRAQLSRALASGLLFGVPFGVLFSPSVGVFLGLLAGLGLTLNAGWQSADLPVHQAPMQGIRISSKAGLMHAFPWLLGGMFGIGWGKVLGEGHELLGLLLGEQLVGHLGSALVDGLVAVLMGALFGGMVGRLVNGLPSGWQVAEPRALSGQDRPVTRGARLMALLPWALGGVLGGMLGVSLAYLFVCVLMIGLNVGLFVGLNTAIQHYTLRLVLARADMLPFRAVTFLEAMSARLLLERDGALYRFRHLLLRDFFADLSDADIEELVCGEMQGG